MATTVSTTSVHNQIHPLAAYIDRMIAGDALLPHSPTNVMEVVGILASYGIVLDAYSNNLIYMAENTYLELFPLLKYFNGEVSPRKLLAHWGHNRINYEYAEYCARTMMWHGGGGLDAYLDTDEFVANARKAIAAKGKFNPLISGLNLIASELWIEQTRLLSYISGLGQFWRVMSDIFTSLSDRYDRGEIETVQQIVTHILDGLVADAARPITYSVPIRGQRYDIIPPSAGLTFLGDTGVPYVEAIFFRGTPFFGTVSYNAQAQYISEDISTFTYGALYADPLPIGGAGIPPTLLMHDMWRHLPSYLHEFYQMSCRGEDDIHVQICQTFQKSMFCVTTAAIAGLAPHPITSEDPNEQAANRAYLEGWMDRFKTSCLEEVNKTVTNASCTLFPITG